MRYTVKLLAVAEADLYRIFSYIEERSPQGALRWEQSFEAAVGRLRINPHIFGPAPESDAIDYDLRQLLFSTKSGHTYRALFRVDGDQVTIYRLRGPSQDMLSVDDLPNG